MARRQRDALIPDSGGRDVAGVETRRRAGEPGELRGGLGFLAGTNYGKRWYGLCLRVSLLTVEFGRRWK